MQHYLTQIESLHAELIGALDGGDVEGVAELVGRRGDLLESLRRTFDAASADERSAIQPALAALLPLDRDLQTRATALRDHLQGDLDQQRDAVGRSSRPATVTGVLDRQA